MLSEISASAEVAQVGEALLDGGFVFGGVGASSSWVDSPASERSAASGWEVSGVEDLGRGRGRPCRRGRGRRAGGGPSGRCRAGWRRRGRGAGAERRAGGDEDAFHPVVAGRAEGGRDQLVGREVVQADRPVPPVAEHDGQVGGEVGVRAVVQLVALVDPLDQRLAGLGVGDLPAGRP